MPIAEKKFDEGRANRPKLTKDATDVFRRKRLLSCILCRNLDRGTLEKAYYDREMTQVDIAKQLSVSEQQISEHFRFHIPNQVAGLVASKTTTDLAEIVVDKLGMLKKHIVELDARCMELYGRELDQANVQNIKSLVSELRNFIKDSALLEGELRSAPLIQLQQYNLQFNQLKEIILHEVPAEYQQKILKVLNVERLEKPIQQ